jgi:DNA-binding response OmpR family regulator
MRNDRYRRAPSQRLLVLVISASVVVRETTRRHLEPRGFSVQSARTFADGLRALAYGIVPAVAIADLCLIDATGPEVARWLQSRHEIPVLLLTDFSRHERSLPGYYEYAADYLARPLRPRELCCRIETVLGKHGQDYTARHRGSPAGETGIRS